MAPPVNEPNPLTTFLPLILMIIPIVIVVYKLAKEKGKNVPLWTILASIPIVNIVSMFYIVGTINNKLEEKLDRIIEALDRNEQIK